MIIKRLLVLQAVLLLGLGVVLFIPKYTGPQPQGINLALPEEVAGWSGTDTEVTEKERIVLGPETEFARKLYTNSFNESIWVSIVLAGHDVSTSLHQPERCLPAQGLTIVDKHIEQMPADPQGHSMFPATRLFNISTIAPASDSRRCIYYYWFVGRDDIVPSPFKRSWIDWRDRLFRGYNQRWAYVVVETWIKNDSPRTQEAADRTIKRFVGQIFPEIRKPESSKS